MEEEYENKIEDNKKIEGKDERATINVVDTENNSLSFKLKKNKSLGKMMEVYCSKQGRALTGVRFLFNGQRIHPKQTMEELGMKDQDTIDVMAEQRGGSNK